MSTPTSSLPPPRTSGLGPFLREGAKLLLRMLGWLVFIVVYVIGLVFFNLGRLLIAASEWGLGRTTKQARSAATPPSPSDSPLRGPGD